ncbi:MAG: hypothetical protein RL385_5311 [Pseudomonadota bacterium]
MNSLHLPRIQLRRRTKLARKVQEAGGSYLAERKYVGLFFDALGRLLSAASQVDPEIARDVEGFPPGTVLGFSVLGDPDLRVQLIARNGRLERLTQQRTPDVNVTFKHIHHAFLVLSFQESTPTAFARQRIITHGDAALSVRFTRCLSRMQAITLPRFVAERALKSVPELGFTDKLKLAGQVYAAMTREMFTRK